MPAILKGLQAIFMLFIHIKNRNQVGVHNLFFNIVYIPIGIILIAVAAFSNFLIIPGLILTGYIVSRMFDAKMREATGDKSKEILHEDRVPEFNTKTQLGFEIVDATSPSTREYALFRDLVIEQAESRLGKNLGRDLMVMVVYFAFAMAGSALPGFSQAALYVGGTILASIIIRWLFMEKLYRPVDTQSKKFLLQHPFKIYGEELASFLHRGGTNLLIGLVLISSSLGSLVTGDPVSGLALLVVAGLHYFVLTKFKQNTDGNIKLLLLRTFDIRENTNLTFGRLLNYWQHIGNYFTVVDVSYLKHKYRIFSRRTLAVVFIVALLAALLDVGLGLIGAMPFPLLSIPSTVVVLIAVMAFEIYQVRRGFIQNRDFIKQRIEKLEQRPRGLGDGMYSGVPTMCHSNTWRSTVAEMVSKTTVVMMDLRGFKQGRDGCKWEMNFLLDNFPVNSLLFLIDEKDDLEFIQNTLQELWTTLRDNGTGNLQMSDPKIRIYRVSKKDEMDVQGIFDQLIGVAFTSGRVKSLLPS